MGLLLLRMLCDCFKSRRRLEAEVLVLRHQLNVLQQRAPRRVQLRSIDRALFVWLYRFCPYILSSVTIVKPERVVRWHRMGFAAYWRWTSRPRGGRPRICKETTRDLIRRMSLGRALHSRPPARDTTAPGLPCRFADISSASQGFCSVLGRVWLRRECTCRGRD